MTGSEQASDARIEEVSLAWLRYQTTNSESDEWAIDPVIEWVDCGRMADAWQLIRDMCGRVDQMIYI